MLIPGAIFFFAQMYVRQFRRWLRTPLLRVYVYTLRTQNITTRVTDKIADVPIKIYAVSAQVSTTVRRIVARS